MPVVFGECLTTETEVGSLEGSGGEEFGEVVRGSDPAGPVGHGEDFGIYSSEMGARRVLSSRVL